MISESVKIVVARKRTNMPYDTQWQHVHTSWDTIHYSTIHSRESVIEECIREFRDTAWIDGLYRKRGHGLGWYEVKIVVVQA